MPKPRLEWLLVFVPVAIFLEVTHADPVAIFACAAIAILPLAGQIGHATEDLALRSGPRVGGILNATFGNLTELIVAFFLILEGELEIVKASLTGSIIGNVLLVLGLAFLLGGWKRSEQTFSQPAVSLYVGTLVIAVVGLLMPALFALSPRATGAHTEAVSIGVAIVLMLVYGLGMVFSFRTHKSLFRPVMAEEEPRWSFGFAMGLLIGATVLVAYMSEVLVGALEPTVEALGMSRLFVGLIVVPIIGNAAEHSSAVVMAMKNKMEIAIEIAIGSSTQIAVFVAPVLVFISLLVGEPMDFVFTAPEIAAVGVSAAIVSFIALDGRSNWFEGAQLLATYAILAVSFFFL
ncbi:MAG TPA: calcium/proton exchanger [Actinomycetota bacterium]|jgi:Ca2+:H+ antiporter